MSFGQLARLLNFKSDHRKLAITGDDHGSLLGIVSSANPHDASSAHSNIGLRLEGPALLPLLQSSLAVARMSGWRGSHAAAGGCGAHRRPFRAEHAAATRTR